MLRDDSDMTSMKSKTPLKHFLWLALAGLVACTQPAENGGTTPVPGPERPLTDPESVVSPADPAAAQIPLADLFASAQARGAVWSKDSRSIIYASTEGGSLNLWRQPINGSAERLSDFPGPKGAFRLAPDGGRLVFQADVGGRAVHDLYLVALQRGSEPQNLTSSDDVSETYPLFSDDGRWLAFSARAKSGSSDNLRLMDLESGASQQFTDEAVSGVHWVPVAFTGDGRTLIANRYDYSMEFGEVHEVDLATGEVTQLTPSGVYASASALSPDGRLVAISLEAASGLRQAALLDRKDGTTRLLDPGEWEQKTTGFSPEGTSLLYATNENGRQQVYLHDVASGRNQRLDLPAGLNAAQGYLATLPEFSPDGRFILFPHSAGSTPTDYWVHDLGEGDSRRITGLSALEAHRLPAVSVVNYSSFDDTVISALMWMPYNLDRDGSAPAVVIAHGGPTAQVMDQFNQVAVALASRGYVVLAPNFRGSTGYGQAFVKANQMDLGGGDLADIVAGAEFLRRTGYVDADRIGIHGGSYGGFMVLMALARTDVFAAGVDMFGIVNWRTMWERGALDHRRYQAGLIGEPETHPEVYDRASPLTYLDDLTAPLLVLQGENDTLVPAHESRQVVEYLQSRGRTVEAKFYPEEGHGLAQPANQHDSLERIVGWFERHLGSVSTVGAGTQP